MPTLHCVIGRLAPVGAALTHLHVHPTPKNTLVTLALLRGPGTVPRSQINTHHLFPPLLTGCNVFTPSVCLTPDHRFQVMMVPQLHKLNR